MANKLTVKESAEIRANLYNIALNAFAENGITNQPITGGALIALADGHYAKVSISICDDDKVESYIAKYAEQQIKSAQRAAERASKAEEKANKAIERLKKEGE